MRGNNALEKFMHHQKVQCSITILSLILIILACVIVIFDFNSMMSMMVLSFLLIAMGACIFNLFFVLKLRNFNHLIPIVETRNSVISTEILNITAKLYQGLANQEFYLLYQPKINARTHRVCGIEALVRWNTTDTNLTLPANFIPYAEKSGVIIPLGYWVLKTACAQLKNWHDMGLVHLKMAVNISAFQFLSGDIVKDIADILWETNLSPAALEIEITESVLMDNAEKCVLMLKVIKSMGVSISIDDFGMGYSSLNYLRRFPIDNLKIDKSFVSNILVNKEDDSIVRAIVAMAKGLKMHLVAEGVETQEQSDYLTALGVDELQGNYFSEPIDTMQLTRYLQQSKAKIIAL